MPDLTTCGAVNEYYPEQHCDLPDGHAVPITIPIDGEIATCDHANTAGGCYWSVTFHPSHARRDNVVRNPTYKVGEHPEHRATAQPEAGHVAKFIDGRVGPMPAGWHCVIDGHPNHSGICALAPIGEPYRLRDGDRFDAGTYRNVSGDTDTEPSSDYYLGWTYRHLDSFPGDTDSERLQAALQDSDRLVPLTRQGIHMGESDSHLFGMEVVPATPLWRIILSRFLYWVAARLDDLRERIEG